MAYELTETKYGFRWGPVEVSRLISDERGGVLLSVMTDTQEVEIRVSPSGRVLDLRHPRPRVPRVAEQGP